MNEIFAGNTRNRVFYADDAFAGLHIMEDLATWTGAHDARARGPHGKGIHQGGGCGRRNMTVFAERHRDREPREYPSAALLGRARPSLRSPRSLSATSTRPALFKNQWQLKTASQWEFVVHLVDAKFVQFSRSWKMRSLSRICSPRQSSMDTSLLRPMGTT